MVHKTGYQWKDGTAVHYVLYSDRMVAPVVALVRDHIPNFLILFMTRSTMALEALIPVALLHPLARAWARRVVMVSMWTLHLAFGATMMLGPFAWSLCVFATLLFSPDDWGRSPPAPSPGARRARVVAFDPRSGAALFACRVLARLDCFRLLTFTAEEGLAAGVAVRDPEHDGLRLSPAAALAAVVEALPVGPAVAWMVRLPGVRDGVNAALGAVERRDVSAFFGLRVPAVSTPAGEALDSAEPARPVPSWMVLASTVVLAGAVALALRINDPLRAVALVVGTTVVVLAVDASVLLPTFALARVGRAVGVGLRELLVLVMLAAAVDQAMVELWAINRRIKVPQPEPLLTLAQRVHFLQGWFMFCPVPILEDGTIVVDALTVDGRHIDPSWGAGARVRSPGGEEPLPVSQIWGDYFNRIRDSGHAGYRQAMQDYMFRYPDRSGHPEDAMSGDVYWIHAMHPRWNEKALWNLQKDKLFSFSNPRAPRPSAP